MLAIKAPLHKAEEVKQDLMQRKLFEHSYNIVRDEEHIYFPVKERFDSPFEFIEQEITPLTSRRPATLKDALKNKVPSEVLERVRTSYEQVGDIVILEIDDALREFEQIIGEALLVVNTKAGTVLAKDAGHEGVFRTQKMRLLAGVDTRVTTHRENGVSLLVDVEEVYFSARLATERKRVAQLVLPGEDVLVLFSGCGPYTCVIGKNSQAANVVGVELNPKGHELAVLNIDKNKLANASAVCGDVKDVVPVLVQRRGKCFDRVLMPLPKSAETFLDVALQAVKPDGVIHFYAFLHQDEFEQAFDWIREACEKENRTPSFHGHTVCGQQAPYVFRLCVDVRIN